jgi:hypothetical protein
VLSAPSLQSHPMPPRITQQSYRLPVSNRTMVGRFLSHPRLLAELPEPKAPNHRVMKSSSRSRRLPWSVSSTSRTQSLSRSEIELDANRHIHLPSEGKGEEYFLDIRSHRTQRGFSLNAFPTSSGRLRPDCRVIGDSSKRVIAQRQRRPMLPARV